MKRFVCCFLIGIMSWLLAFSAFAHTWTTYSPEEYTLVGDLNIDKKIDAKDALEVLKFSVSKFAMFLPENPTAEQTLKYEQYQYYITIMRIIGDVTGDGYVNSQDALHILQYAVGKRDAFENNDLSDLRNLVYPELVPTTPTNITPTDK